MTSAPSQTDDAINTSLEVIKAAYPRIYQSITLLWGTAELNDKFNQWIIMDRDNRQGFPAEVASALLKVAAVHLLVFSDVERVSRSGDDLVRKDVHTW